jgi:hypothetical protein
MLLDSIVLFVLFIIAVVAAERDGGAFFVVFIGFGYLALRTYLIRQTHEGVMQDLAKRLRGLELNQMKLQGLAVPKPADAVATPPQPAPATQQPAAQQPYRPPVAPSPEIPKPTPIATPVAPVAIQRPTLPAAPPVFPTQAPATPPPPPKPPIPTPVPVPVRSASVTSSVASPVRATAPAKRTQNMEEFIGGQVLLKVGIVILVLGTVFGLAYAFGGTPAGKVLLGLLGSAVLLGLGVWIERRERYQIFGRSCIGGGWAMLFATVFSMYHVEAARVLPLTPSGETLDFLLLFGVAAGMIGHSLYYRSQRVTSLAFGLAFLTIAISHSTVWSLGAEVFLALALVIIVHRLRWYEMEVFGVLAAYITHWIWLYPIIEPMGSQKREFPEYVASIALLGFYWITFRGSYVWREIRTTYQENASTVAAILNTSLLLFVAKYQSSHPEYAFPALLTLGGIEFILGQLPFVKKRRAAFIVLSIIGATLLMVAFPMRASIRQNPQQLSLIWLAMAEAFFLAGVALKEHIFRWLGIAASAVVVVQAIATQDYSAAPALSAGVMLGTLALVFYFNSEVVPRAWLRVVSGSLESAALQIFSYIAAFCAFAAGWQVWPHQWSAVAWAAMALVLAMAGRRFTALDLVRQSYLFSLVSFFALFMVNLPMDHTPQERNFRFLTMSITAALFYLCALWHGAVDSNHARDIRATHNWAASLVAVVIAVLQSPDIWLAVVWTAMALIFAVVGRFAKFREFSVQACVLVLGIFVTAIMYDIPAAFLVYGMSGRLVTGGSVVIGIYALSLLLKVPGFSLLEHAPAMVTWLASFLVALLLWYQLGATNRALGWAALGLVFFEWGIARKSLHPRMQAYVATTAAFCYMFVGNLDARFERNQMLMTVLPLVVIFYYVYERLYRSRIEAFLRGDHSLRAFAWHAAMGTITLAALLRATVPEANVVIAWAAMVTLLIALSTASRRALFADHALVLTFVVLLRGVLMNVLDQRPSMVASRAMTVGITLALLFSALPFAYRMRRVGGAPPQLGNDFRSFLGKAGARPEQILFFIPIALLTTLIFFSERSGTITLWLGLEGLAVFVFALWVNERSFRLTGLALLMLCAAKILFMDLFRMERRDQILTALGVGVILISVGFLYSKYRERIRELL